MENIDTLTAQAISLVKNLRRTSPELESSIALAIGSTLGMIGDNGTVGRELAAIAAALELEDAGHSRRAA